MPQAEKAAESHEANKAPIDFSAGRHPHDLDELVHVPTRSRYARKLQEIVDAIARGEAEVGAVYPIGRFNDPGTAANTAKVLKDRKDIPAGVEFNLVPIVVSKTKSMLWAGVIDPNEAIENVDEVVGGEPIEPADDEIEFLVEPEDRADREDDWS